MAGGMVGKSNTKSVKFGSFGNEAFKDSQSEVAPKSPQKLSLRGILGLNQTVELGKSASKVENQSKPFFNSFSHLEQEQTQLLHQHQKELERALNELREEIHKLTKATDNLEKDVVKIAETPIVEASEYQLNFLNRIRTFISNFRKNITEAGLWMDAFSAKKKKKNMFWNTVKNKKKGGEQYLFSNEHSAARSVA